jgi:TonB family protein
MFENVMLTGSPKGKRVWTTCAGVTGQVLLVAAMAIAPMVWPEAMPPAVFTMLVPTAPPGPPAKPSSETKPPAHPALKIKKYDPTRGLVQPALVPPTIRMIAEEPAPVVGNSAAPSPWVVGAFDPGPSSGPLRDIARAGRNAQPDEPLRPPVTAITPDVPIRRVTVGGRVQPPRLLTQVEPRYPHLATMAHVEGAVTLRGVIAIDGRIASLAIESGNPLLAPAALEAVRQWRYAPTLLDGVPVELDTIIVVTFKFFR